MIAWLNKFALPLGLILIAGLIVGAGLIVKATLPKSAADDNQKITIDIAGAITNPGVYTFNDGSIIEDAIKTAGGITDNADLDMIAKIINRAALLNDHGKIYIPTKQDSGNLAVALGAASTNMSDSSGSLVTGLININTADAKTLDILPGIGPVMASRIIAYRQAKNGFKKKEDLMKVEGIGTATYNKLKDRITI